MPPEDATLRAKIDTAIMRAAELLDFEDIDGDDDEIWNRVHEERYHCGHCTVRVVMEVVWPAVEEYVTFLETMVYGATDGAS